MKIELQNKIKESFKKKYLFRLHMSFIVLTTVALGLFSNYILYNLLGLNSPIIRYPFTVVVSYLWFLLVVRIYLKNIILEDSDLSVLDFVDAPSVPGDIIIPRVANGPTWQGGGGQFSGGGSSGVWGDSSSKAVELKSSSSSSKFSVFDVFDDSAGVVLIVVGLIGAAVFGSGVYLVWHSPEILSECLLQILLVSSLKKKLKTRSVSEWLNHLFKVSIIPFLIVVAMSLAAGAFLRIKCPDSNSLREARTSCIPR